MSFHTFEIEDEVLHLLDFASDMCFCCIPLYEISYVGPGSFIYRTAS